MHSPCFVCVTVCVWTHFIIARSLSLLPCSNFTSTPSVPSLQKELTLTPAGTTDTGHAKVADVIAIATHVSLKEGK